MKQQSNARVPRGLVSVRADAGSPGEVKALIEQLNQAFATFKDEHSKQLDEVKKGTHDALQALKVEKINADISRLQSAIDDANMKIASAQMGDGTGQRLKDSEYSDAFNAHFKKGDVQAALNKGAADEGGYLAPVEWDRTITDKLVLVSPMRQLAAELLPMVAPRPPRTQNSVIVPKMSEVASLRPPDSFE